MYNNGQIGHQDKDHSNPCYQLKGHRDHHSPPSIENYLQFFHYLPKYFFLISLVVNQSLPKLQFWLLRSLVLKLFDWHFVRSN